MTTTNVTESPRSTIDETVLNTFLEKVLSDLAANYGGVMVSLGRRLGLYHALDGAGPLNSHELAARAGCAERYVREWLNSQVAAGYVNYHPVSQTYELTPEQAHVLADEQSPVYMTPAWEVPASMWVDVEKAIAAFKSGEGVPWSDHDERLYCGVAAFYRNCYKGQLVPEWLPALDDVVDKLTSGGLVADVGCGYGHSSVLMAQAFPRSRFRGFDGHPLSIAEARENARAAGVGGRVEFQVATAQTYPGEKFDLICFFDCLHDMGDPVGAARHALEALAPDGTVMAVEPFANDNVEDNINPVGRLYYSASTTLCCAHSLSEEVGLALGGQAGPARLESVFRQAGFTRFRVAKENPFNLIIEARP